MVVMSLRRALSLLRWTKQPTRRVNLTPGVAELSSQARILVEICFTSSWFSNHQISPRAYRVVLVAGTGLYSHTDNILHFIQQGALPNVRWRPLVNEMQYLNTQHFHHQQLSAAVHDQTTHLVTHLVWPGVTGVPSP